MLVLRCAVLLACSEKRKKKKKRDKGMKEKGAAAAEEAAVAPPSGEEVEEPAEPAFEPEEEEAEETEEMKSDEEQDDDDDDDMAAGGDEGDKASITAASITQQSARSSVTSSRSRAASSASVSASYQSIDSTGDSDVDMDDADEQDAKAPSPAAAAAAAESNDSIRYCVPHAQTALPMFKVKLIARRAVGVKRTFDLTVAGPAGVEPAFTAAGIVVHNCPIFSIPGRLFPVTVLYSKEPEQDYLEAALITVMQVHLSQPPGDILVFLTGKEEIDTACLAADTPVLVYVDGDVDSAPVSMPLHAVSPARDALVAPDYTAARILSFKRRSGKAMRTVSQQHGMAYDVTADHTLTVAMKGFPPTFSRRYTRGSLDEEACIVLRWLAPADGRGAPALRQTRFLVDTRAPLSDRYCFSDDAANTATEQSADALPDGCTLIQQGTNHIDYRDSAGARQTRRFPVYSAKRHEAITYRSYDEAQEDAEAVLAFEEAAGRVLHDGQLLDIALLAFERIPTDIARYFVGAKSARPVPQLAGVDVAAELKLLPPYILGLWLGDGCRRDDGFSFCSLDNELLQAVQDFAADAGLSCSVDTRDLTSDGAAAAGELEDGAVAELVEHKERSYSCVHVGGRAGVALKALGLDRQSMQQRANDKRVPEQYMVASEADRLALLAGLLDTDGSRWHGLFVFSQQEARRELVRQVKALAESLGIEASDIWTTDKLPQSGLSQFSDGAATHKHHHVRLSGPRCRAIPTRLPRKQIPDGVRFKRAEAMRLSISDAPEQDHIAMQVDGSGRFLLADSTVTHNCEILFDRMQSLGKGAPMLHVLPVYSMLPSEQQTKIFEPAPVGTRKCFPALQTRVLTDAGFLFLDEIQRRLTAGQRVLYACYEPHSREPQRKHEDAMKGRLLYCEGELHLPPSREWPQTLIEVSSSNEQRRWAQGSGAHGSGMSDAQSDEDEDSSCDEADEQDDDATLPARLRSRHVSLLVTPDHDMYVQMGNAIVSTRGHQFSPKQVRPGRAKDHAPAKVVAPDKVQASQLLGARHDRASVRLLACASSGYTPSPQVAAEAERAVRAALQLTTRAQFDVFLELFGFWLGDGSMQYAGRGHCDAVVFALVKQADIDWLDATLPRAGLRDADVERSVTRLQRRDGRPKCVVTWRVINRAWFDFFDAEFGLKYKSSRYYDRAAAVAKQGNAVRATPPPSAASPSVTRSLHSTTHSSTSTPASHSSNSGISSLTDKQVSAVRCESCGSGRRPRQLLLCERCNLGWHTHCLVPALARVPKEDWYCDMCEAIVASLASLKEPEPSRDEERTAADSVEEKDAGESMLEEVEVEEEKEESSAASRRGVVSSSSGSTSTDGVQYDARDVTALLLGMGCAVAQVESALAEHREYTYDRPQLYDVNAVLETIIAWESAGDGLHSPPPDSMPPLSDDPHVPPVKQEPPIAVDTPIKEERMPPRKEEPPSDDDTPDDGELFDPDSPESPTKSVKWLPLWVVMHLPPRELRLFFYGLYRADGCFEAGKHLIHTSGVSFRDQLMQVLLHCGYTAHSALMCAAGEVRAYHWHDQSVDKTVYTLKEYEALTVAEQANYVPIAATADSWAVTWSEPVSSGEAPCWPLIRRQKGITEVPYSEAEHGAIWCVKVAHGDHLIVAQRAHRDPGTGVVTKQSRPIIVGQCVIATNIAEASLTIDGILYVVDPGFCKQKVYSPKLGMDSLVVTPISQASAQQRSGRAGRTGPGRCFRLYTESAYKNEMLPMTPPEIQRTNLAMHVLTLKAMGINDLLHFDWMDPPPVQTLITALQLLFNLGALDEEGLLTRLGRKMAEFPLEPPMSKMLIASVDLGCSDELLTIVAMLSIQSPFHRPKDKQAAADAKRAKFFQAEGDHLTVLAVYKGWAASGYSKTWAFDNFLQDRSLRQAQDIRKQLLSIMDRYRMPISSARNNYTLVSKAVCSGYFMHAAKKDPEEGYKSLVDQQPVHIHPSSALFNHQPPLVVYHQLVLTSKEYMREVLAVQPAWLMELAPNFYSPVPHDRMSRRKKRERIQPLYDRYNAPNEWRLSKRKG